MKRTAPSRGKKKEEDAALLDELGGSSELLRITPKIARSIKKFGHCVEHRLSHVLACSADDNVLVYFSYPKGKGILLSHDTKGVWSLFPNGVFAPADERAGMLLELASTLLRKKSVKKVILEVDEELRRQVLLGLEGYRGLRAVKTNYVLYWPTFDMSRFDLGLSGRRWKKMRNIKNRFIKQHRIRVVDTKTVPKEKLRKIVDMWLKRRMHSDTVEEGYYYNLIESKFKGFTLAKTLMVDSEPCTITAGWEVPNGKKHYYSAIGILNYRHKGLGEFANLLDLMTLKKKKYALVDFGGSDKSLLAFKNKFRPHDIYRTYIFSIVRK